MNDDNPEQKPEQHPAIDLVIDELVLHGIPASGRAPFEEAFRRELVRLLATEPLANFTGGRIDLRRPIGLRVRRGDGAGQLGHQLARAVHGTLRRQ